MMIVNVARPIHTQTPVWISFEERLFAALYNYNVVKINEIKEKLPK